MSTAHWCSPQAAMLSPQPAPEPGEASGGLVHRRKLRLGCEAGGGQRRMGF